MTSIRAYCDIHGDFTLTVHQVKLFHCTTDGRLHCVYPCLCGGLKVLWLHPIVFARLACVIVPTEWTLPSELFEPRPDLPALTLFDLVDGMRELDRVVTVEDCLRYPARRRCYACEGAVPVTEEEDPGAVLPLNPTKEPPR